ncbi:aspartate/glutamate racemase family protein [Glutamicibacter sp.]|uniref:aspartate/glutamate racemase family protein n=1 Tax=Glutamicibacter sp. TaxID=1931995 RepID=UPI0028BE5CBC|nr:aspartate/glutamate racemase family protein [Glutamicibacter sp.]
MDTDSRTLRVVLVNPNTNSATTTMMTELAQQSAVSAQITVEAATVNYGPGMIIEPTALAESANAVVERIAQRVDAGALDAVIVSAIGDPGRDELADCLDIPVVGIGQAAILEASAGGRPYAMATTTHELAGSLRDLVHHYGCEENFLGVYLTESAPLELASNPQAQDEELRAATEEAVAAGAQAVIIAGGPLSETARRLRETTDALIVEPIPAAMARVERLLGS